MVAALNKRTANVRAGLRTPGPKPRSRGAVLKDVWPCVLAIMLSFGAGMLVFVHFTYLPTQVGLQCPTAG